MHQTITENADSTMAQGILSPKFSPGQIVATPGALALLEEHHCSPIDLLSRHLCGDWGDLPPEDSGLNNDALNGGGRLLSAYRIGENARMWIITEWDRSVTTLLLPSEY